MWIPPQTTVPPRAMARSAIGTRSPAGAQMLPAPSSSGAGPAVAPAQLAHRSPAKPRAPAPPGPVPGGDALGPRSGAFDHPDDLVPEHQRELRLQELPVHDVKIRPADPADPNPKQHIARTGVRNGDVLEPQRLVRRIEDHRPHR